MSVVRIYIICLCFMWGCATKNYPQETNCGFVLSIHATEWDATDSIAVRLKNDNTFDVEVSDPACPVNTFLELYDMENKRIPELMMYKANPSCKERFFEVKSNQTLEFLYPFSLFKLFQVKEGAFFLLKIRFEGVVTKADKKFICKNVNLQTVIKIK